MLSTFHMCEEELGTIGITVPCAMTIFLSVVSINLCFCSVIILLQRWVTNPTPNTQHATPPIHVVPLTSPARAHTCLQA